MSTGEKVSELLPCPFCGSKNIDPEGWMDGERNIGPVCDDCGASAERVEAWNSRVSIEDSQDTVRLNALENAVDEGSCPGVINDDAGRWAVSEDGMQNVPDNDIPTDIRTTFFIEATKWKPSIREAIDAWMAECEADSAMSQETP